MYKNLKLSETDLKLLENNNTTIKQVEFNKKEEIHIYIEKDIRNLRNLINDDNYLTYLDEWRYNVDFARMFNKLIKLDFIEVSNLIDEFIEINMYNALKRWENNKELLKESYLNDLNNAKKIRSC